MRYKKIRPLVFLIGFIFPFIFWGQGETSNWYFGEEAGPQFNNDGSVNALTDGRLNTFEGCATISNPFGDLLFYTDGILVYDRNHNIMENGRVYMVTPPVHSPPLSYRSQKTPTSIIYLL